MVGRNTYGRSTRVVGGHTWDRVVSEGMWDVNLHAGRKERGWATEGRESVGSSSA